MMQTPDHPHLRYSPLKAVSLILVPTKTWSFESLTNAATSKYAPLFPKIEHRRVRRVYELADDQDEGGDTIDISIPDDQPHMRLLAEDDETYISIGPRFLGYHQGIYEGWAKLRLILMGIMDVAFSDDEQIEFEFISLKYDNEITIESGVQKAISPWLLPLPHPTSEDSDMIAYQAVRMVEFHDGSQRISINYPIPSEMTGAAAVALSIDHSQIYPTEQISRKELIQWLDIAHDRIYSTFTQAIPDEKMEAMK